MIYSPGIMTEWQRKAAALSAHALCLLLDVLESWPDKSRMVEAIKAAAPADAAAVIDVIDALNREAAR